MSGTRAAKQRRRDAELVPEQPIERVSRGAGTLAMIHARHPVLRSPAALVRPEDEPGIARLQERLVVTMRARGGMGLALPQVGLPYAAFVDDAGAIWCNPTIELYVGQEEALEGCLSLPGLWYAVPRALELRVSARRLGEAQASTQRLTGLTARMWQHEVDHLGGLLVSRFRRSTERAGTPLPEGAAARIAIAAGQEAE